MLRIQASTSIGYEIPQKEEGPKLFKYSSKELPLDDKDRP